LVAASFFGYPRKSSVAKKNYALSKMAKGTRQKPAFKRVITRAGRVMYFDQGRRITDAAGAKRYIQREFSNIKDPVNLTAAEMRSYRSRQGAEKNREKFNQRLRDSFRFGGRFIPKYLELLMRELKLIGKDSNRELKKEFPDVKNFGDLLRRINQTLSNTTIYAGQYGLANEKRKRETFESVIDIAERIDEGAYENLRLVVIKTDGERIEQETAKQCSRRAKGLEAIRDWEVKEIDDIVKTERNPAYVIFIHSADIDVEKGTVTIDLNDSDSKVQNSP
jgi:hypothetical protein